MKILLQLVNIVVFSLIMATPSFGLSLTVEQTIERVINHYPSIKVAAIQVERAKQEQTKIEGQFGWNLSGQAGISRNVSLFGIPSNKLDVGGSYSKQLETGSTLSLDASISHENSETSFSPTFPNPVTSTAVNLTYREPLAKGADNPAYTLAKKNAEAALSIKNAEKINLYDQLAEQIIELYLSMAATKAQMTNTSKAISRTQRLKKFIIDKEKLGISEEKDLLQVDAQLKNLQASLSGLKIIWNKQQISLNRLMGTNANTEIQPIVKLNPFIDHSFDSVYTQAKTHNGDIKAIDGKIKLAENSIKLQRDEQDDNLDLILFVGARNQSGDLAVGSSNESDLVGGARLEFSQLQDKTSLDAQLYEAQLERSASIESKRQVLEDLHYDVAGLLAEIKSGYEAVNVYKQSVDSEYAKLKEAEKRYETGRSDTDQIIQFESQLSTAELSLEIQQIELVKRNLLLQLMKGELWKSIKMPDINQFIKGESE